MRAPFFVDSNIGPGDWASAPSPTFVTDIANVVEYTSEPAEYAPVTDICDRRLDLPVVSTMNQTQAAGSYDLS